MDGIKILSINCRGFGDNNKRKDFLILLDKKKFEYIAYKIPTWSMIILNTYELNEVLKFT